MFSTNGKTAVTTRAIGVHFDKLITLAKIENSDKRGLVPYSLRHYFITQRVNSNIPIAIVAEMCTDASSNKLLKYYDIEWKVSDMKGAFIASKTYKKEDCR